MESNQNTLQSEGKSKLAIAELLLSQNTLCLQMMLSTQLSQPLFNDLSFLEGTIRCNHLLSYNLIISYMTEDFSQKQSGETLEIIEQNEPSVQQEEQKSQQVEEEVKEVEEQSDISEEELFQYEFFEDIGFSKKEINRIPIIQAKELLKSKELELENMMVKQKTICKKKHPRPELSSTQEKCCICLQNYRSNTKLRQLPCKHQFHVKCIDRWLKKSKKCPFCRKIVKINEL